MHGKQCPVCDSSSGQDYDFQEMMFGTLTKHIYSECDNCGCLYLNNNQITKDIYPHDYYSFNTQSFVSSPWWQDWITLHRYRDLLFRNDIVGLLFNKLFNLNDERLAWLQKIQFRSYSDKILDVGCGDGELLHYLSTIGFKNLLGIDKYIKDNFISEGFKIFKKDIFELEDSFDFIMFHHSFEHLPDPRRILLKAKAIAKKNGIILIRMPYKDSEAWEQYRGHWVQIDAPRHKVIYSRKAMEILFQKVNLQIQEIFWDSTSFQFWGSEQYRKGISLYSPNSYHVSPSTSIFSANDISIFEGVAQALNRNGRGDQVAVILAMT